MIGILLSQRLRRDGRQLALWIIGTAAMAYLSYAGVTSSFSTEQERTSLLAAALANPVILLFRGLPSGADEGAFMLFLILPWLTMLAAFMSTFLAVRHTRAEEEDGRAELVGATRAGRTLPVMATVLHGTVANLALAALTTLAFVATGQDLNGSLLSGVAAGAVGITFLGVGLLGAQLMRTSRGANSFSVWILLTTFVMCGLGNAIGTPSDDLTRMESSWLAWLSPFGWAENTRPFADDAWWPLLLCVGLGAILIGISIALATTRDLGESFVPERHGRADATPALSSSTGLVWRLTRGAALGWAIGGLIIGMLSTTLASLVEEIGADNPAVEDILNQIAGAGDVQQATVTTFFTMLGILAACAGVQVICRARSEEARGTAEIVLATSVDRVRWLADYIVVAVLAAVIVIGAAIGGAALGIAGQDGSWDVMRDVWVTASGQAVAASVFIMVTALVFTFAPRLTIPLGWMLVVVGAVLGLFGPVFGLPEWATHLSPVGVGPIVDGDAIDVRGLWWLIGVTVIALGTTLGLMRRRELAPAG
ncbi:ABC transporter permease [Microbacterium sp. C7(2022)]|uniref:ABC transporter permease n=1 Tax=Microbacterium sp. C7(2022) TaxID=2992759 RepID=UPI00237C1E91|nr:polyketide antibiotic transporter [Microbacterium sp. C7(2022)]MDE0546574.1 polyketide antibiotic transporter [Microbacterium sp. C7(2022)]